MLQPHLLRVLWRFIKPEIEELVLYVSAIALFTGTAFFKVVNNSQTREAQTIGESINLINDQIVFITNGGETAAKIFTFATWFVIGTVVYMIAWFVTSFAGGAFKDIEVSNTYVHPRSFQKSNFWGAIIARTVLRAAAGISFIVYVSFWLSVLAPKWLGDFEAVFSGSQLLAALPNLLVSIFLIIISLHIAAIFFRVILLRSKYFYEH